MVHFPGRPRCARRPHDVLRAVDGVDLRDRAAARRSAWSGESGCGKSTLGRCIVGLYQPTAGEVLFAGEPLAAKRERAQRRRIQMVFQDPYSSLNPRMTVRQTLSELLRVHNMVPPGQVEARCRELMDLVGLAPRRAGRAPPPVLRRPAPARVDRPRAGARAGGAGRRRAGVGPRRVGAGDGAQPARRAAAAAGADDAVHRPQHGGRPPRLRPGGRHVPGPDRRDGAHRRAVHQPPPPLHAGADEGRPAAGAGPRVRGRGRGRRPGQPDLTRPPAAGSIPAARSPRTSAREQQPEPPAGRDRRTWPRATSPGRPRPRATSPRSSRRQRERYRFRRPCSDA